MFNPNGDWECEHARFRAGFGDCDICQRRAAERRVVELEAALRLAASNLDMHPGTLLADANHDRCNHDCCRVLAEEAGAECGCKGGPVSYVCPVKSLSEDYYPAGASTPIKLPRSVGVAAIFGTWPGDETDEEMDEVLYGEKRRAEQEREAIDRVIQLVRDCRCCSEGERTFVMKEALSAIDAARKCACDDDYKCARHFLDADRR